MERVSADQGAISVVATKALSPIQGVASYGYAVNQLPKSVVREIRTLRSVGAGGGRPPLATRCRWKSVLKTTRQRPTLLHLAGTGQPDRSFTRAMSRTGSCHRRDGSRSQGRVRQA